LTAWPTEELRQIAGADDLHIAPCREDGVTYRSPTWILSVAVEDALYVRGFNGQKSSWYEAAVRQKAGQIDVAGGLKDVTFEAVDGPAYEEINGLIDNAYRAKYRASPYLNAMVGKRARAATVKIMPR
jgi:hypothetical protein